MLANLFRDNHEPLFLNEGSYHSELVLKKMEALRSVVDSRDAERLDRDIALLRCGIAGEKRVAFELSNAHYPLVFMHDLNLVHDGTTAQIDFFVISPYNAYVLECKNLVGDIQVGQDGSFVRTFGTGRSRRREGIYSPVTQNARHVELIRAMVRARNGRLVSAVFGRALDSYFRSVVVLANDKSVLSMSRAPKDVRAQIVRCDQLVAHIKKCDQESSKKSERDSFKAMRNIAESWLARSRPLQVDLTGKYAIREAADAGARQPEPAAAGAPQPAAAVQQPAAPAQATAPVCPVCGSPMRLRTARNGTHKGEQFWGCSTWGTTRCPGIIPVSKASGSQGA